MNDARAFLAPARQEAIQAAVAAAEERTSAEIVCALATESGRYDRAESLAGLAFALFTLAVANAVALGVNAEGSWSDPRALPFPWQCLCVAGGFLAGSVAASYLHPLRWLFTTRREMEAEARRAAHFLFAARGLQRTAGRGGLLIFVSLFERRVLILADDGILTPLGQPFLDRLRDAAVAELRAGRRAETFTLPLDIALPELERHLPRQPGDKNELPNQLLVLHPRP